jgi:hypothetical protein
MFPELNFGTDPEFFAVYERDDKQYALSPALLESYSGIKPIIEDIKHPMYLNYEDFSWMQDGVAFESTYKKVFKNAKELFTTVNNSLDCLNEFVSKLNFEGQEIKLYKKPVVSIEPQLYLPLLSDQKIFQGFIFGCDKDWDASDINYKCKTVDVLTHEYRYGGGHLHISGISDLYEKILVSIKLMACTVGLFHVANSNFPELEKQRATTYGKPCRYRPQKYKDGTLGIEYRTPSNSWLSFSVEKIDEMLDWANKAVFYLINPQIGQEILEDLFPEACNAIVNSDQDSAKKILSQLK